MTVGNDATMATYTAERATAPMTSADLDAVAVGLANAIRRMVESGSRIRLVRVGYEPARRVWMGVFEAESAQLLHLALRLAQLPAADVSKVG